MLVRLGLVRIDGKSEVASNELHNTHNGMIMWKHSGGGGGGWTKTCQCLTIYVLFVHLFEPGLSCRFGHNHGPPIENRH